jgi:hypothetical protein
MKTKLISASLLMTALALTAALPTLAQNTAPVGTGTSVTPKPPAPTLIVKGIKPFSAECGYKSLAGFYRWGVFQLTGEWITVLDARKAVAEQLATP